MSPSENVLNSFIIFFHHLLPSHARAVDMPEFHFQEHPYSQTWFWTPSDHGSLGTFPPQLKSFVFFSSQEKTFMPFNLPQFQDDVFILTKISHHFYLANQFLICQISESKVPVPLTAASTFWGNQICVIVAEGNCLWILHHAASTQRSPGNARLWGIKEPHGQLLQPVTATSPNTLLSSGRTLDL